MRVLDLTKPSSDDDILDFVSDLLYASYQHNRQASPSILPVQWAPVFPAWERYERRYQSEPKS